MNNSDVFLFTTTTANSTTVAVNEYETEIPSTATTLSINDSTEDAVTIVNTLLHQLGSDVTDNISKTDFDSDLDLVTKVTETFYNITNVLNETENNSITETTTIDDISKTGSDSILTTLPSIINDSVVHLEDLVTNVTESFINITNIFNETENNSVTESTTIDDDYILSTLPSFSNDSINHLNSVDAKNNGSLSSFINITNELSDTEYNSKNETINDLLSTSTEFSFTTDNTVAPQSEGNISLNGIIHNILNNTLNKDQLPILINSANDTVTKELTSTFANDFNNIINETLVLSSDKLLEPNLTTEIFQSISNINNSSYEDSPSVTHWLDDGMEVENLLFVSYHLVFPILIFLALVFNCLALYVFRKPKLASLSESRYVIKITYNILLFKFRYYGVHYNLLMF